jgi:hypothetical protein
MTPITWLRNTDNLPEPQRIDVPTPAYPTVDRTEPTCPPQSGDVQPAQMRDRYSEFGMARYKPRPYDESADEIGGRRDYYDGLGD